MIVLSQRLKLIASLVRKQSKLADIGSDHALLPAYLASRGLITFAVAGEYNEGPLRAAQKQVAQLNLQHMIDVRQGDGLAVIAPGEVDCVTIAGMGGHLIVRILEEGQHKLSGVQQLVLQPNVGEVFVRQWLLANDWYLQEEMIIAEDDHLYVIMHASKVEDAARLNDQLYTPYLIGADTEKSCLITSEEQLRFGPHLLRQPNVALVNQISWHVEKTEKIYEQMAQSNSEQTREKQMQYRHDIQRMEEILRCIRQDMKS